MSTPVEDIDPPTVSQRLSPRARTAMAGDDEDRIVALQPRGAGLSDDFGDEPTVALRPSPDREPSGSGDAVLQGAASVVQQLETLPERGLARAAAPLLLIVAQLRNSVDRADVTALRRQVTQEMDRFQQVAQKEGVEAGDILAARYVLCATIDETVLMTPWGSRSEWSANSLLNQYHNETWGGEKVFQILDWIKGNAEKKLPLLILIHSCLMLGFEGRYRVLERGRDQLEDLREDVSKIIRKYTQVKADAPLSGNARGVEKGRKINSYVPLWMVAVGAVCLLLVVHTYVHFILSEAVGPTIDRIETVTRSGG